MQVILKGGAYDGQEMVVPDEVNAFYLVYSGESLLYEKTFESNDTGVPVFEWIPND